MQCNIPRTGPLNLERIQTKCEYKLAIKCAKNLWDRQRKENVSIKLACKDYKSFWRAWKQLDKQNFQVHKSNGEGLNEDKEICEGFVKHCMSCFNEPSTNTQLKMSLMKCITLI